jgi:hypothetical protein
VQPAESESFGCYRLANPQQIADALNQRGITAARRGAWDY